MSDVYRENYELKRDLSRSESRRSAMEERVRMLERDIAEITPRREARVSKVADVVSGFPDILLERDRANIVKLITMMIEHEIYVFERAYRYVVFNGQSLPDIIRAAKVDALTTAIKKILPWIRQSDNNRVVFYELNELLRAETGEGFKEVKL